MYYQKSISVFFFFVFCIFKLASCSDDDAKKEDMFTLKENPKIAVISDLHYFDLSLLKSKGSAFQNYLMADRKLIEESSAITESVVNSLLEEKPDIVFVCGDLTKDGEKKSHESLIVQLEKLRSSGIKILVIPGNHDINNPHSFIFDGDKQISTPSISPTEFKSLYNNYGYSNAIAQGPDLCYVSEPAKDLWVIAIDACEYKENISLGKPVTKGSLSAEKLAWIEEKTKEGVSKGKTVFGLMHHGLLEHFVGQEALFSEYVVSDWQNISTKLANAGMKLVFTGHFHAQDVVKKNVDENKFVFDIETGSTVTAPCPYRIMQMDGKKITINTKLVQSVNFNGIPSGQTFQQHAGKYLADGMQVVSQYMLMAPPYNVPQEQAVQISPLFSETFIAHYKGDEGEPSAQTKPILDMLLGTPAYAPIGLAVQSVWNDPSPADNNIVIELTTGNIEQ